MMKDDITMLMRRVAIIEQKLGIAEPVALNLEARGYSPKEADATSKRLEKLKTIFEHGAPLHAGREAYSRDVRDFNRSWRCIVEDMGLHVGDPRRTEAETLLQMLGVYRIEDRKGVKFFTL